MAKTVEEILGILTNYEVDAPVKVFEVYYGFNQPEEKIVFHGTFGTLPDHLKDIRYAEASSAEQTGFVAVKYYDHKSFEGKKLFQQLQIQRLSD